MADITLINLNMLFIRYGEEAEREFHVPLGPLYLTTAIENAGYDVDFRDYQLCKEADLFDINTFFNFIQNPSKIIGISCMANLLPFTILMSKMIKQRYPDRILVLGGVGTKSVENKLLEKFPWIDIICRGEAEITAPQLLTAIGRHNSLSSVKGISYRENDTIYHNPDQDRISDLDSIKLPAFHKVPIESYSGYGMMTSRGCPYPCTFCSVAPVWNFETYSRSAKNIVSEMKLLNEKAGVDLFLFQDEFFVSGKQQVMEFCNELQKSNLNVEWKAFGRVNLVDYEMMHAMADNGCVELRFGIESGSDKILTEIKKGFTTKQSLDIIPKAIDIFPRVDAFYVWGFPFETMEDFNQSLFQMVSFRMMGARILPSLLSLLPQTEIYNQWSNKVELEFCPYLFPEFVFTGHEICHGGNIEIPEKYNEYFNLIQQNPDIFPGFFHINLNENVLPKLKLLRKFGFYPEPDITTNESNTESCGAHSPRIEPHNLATRS